MKRKINEDFEEPVVIIVSKIRQDDATVDCNDLKDVFVDAGAEVEGEYKDGETHMIVSGLSKEEVTKILDDYLDNTGCMFAKDYILEDIIAEEEMANEAKHQLHESVGRQKYQRIIDVEDEAEEIDQDLQDVEPLNDETDFPAYDDVDVEAEELTNDEMSELDKLENVLAEAEEAGFETINFDEDIILETELDDQDVVVYSINTEGILDTNIGDVNIEELDDEDLETLIELVEARMDVIEIPDEEEEISPRFEKIEKHVHLEEKRKGCCPTAPSINENVKIVLNDLNKKSIAAKAEKKMMNESFNTIISNIDNKILEEKTLNALKDNKSCLHENVKVNGKSFKDYTTEELKALYAKLEESKKSLTEKLKNSLNESVSQDIKDNLNKRNRLMEYIDEEVTYRETRQKYVSVNEDSSTISDEELANLFGPAQGEEKPEESEEQKEENSEESKEENSEESKEENSEESEEEQQEELPEDEVELSRIEITLKDAEALKDLKDACIEAEIPEDAFECEGLKEESEEGESEESDEEAFEEEPEEDEESEEAEEDNATKEDEEDANESIYYHNISKLFEGEVETENNEEGSEESEDEESEGDKAEETEETEEDNKEDEEPEEFKFILTNTDYAAKLAKVLEDVYGITKEEFEDMIGGEIVEEDADSEEESEDEDSKEEAEESKDEETEDSEEKKDEEDDDIDPSELFKGL